MVSPQAGVDFQTFSKLGGALAMATEVTELGTFNKMKVSLQS
jgi:hypothetical protein